MNKIKKQKDLLEIISNFKNEGKEIVAMSGSFDILHIGHIKSFQEAKKQGDILIVLLNSDKSIKLYKGPSRPINNQQIRSQMLSAIEYIDYICIFDQTNPKNILAKIKPDVYCQGRDWGENSIERKIIENNGGKIHLLDWQEGYSTTNLIKSIIEFNNTPVKKAVFLDRDGTINIDDPEYTHKKENLKFKKNVLNGLKKLSNSDYELFIVTNQSGIARGYFSEKDLKKLNDWLIKRLNKEGIKIKKIYYCPHHPDFTKDCNCRKPKIGMLVKAVKEYGISLNKSWVIGDSKEDIIMAREANVKSIKIGDKMPKRLKLEPNYYASDLLQASQIVLNHK